MKYIDNFLNQITMYRLVLYGLSLTTLVAIIFSFVGIISFSPLSLIGSLFVLLVVCWITNYLFSRAFNAPTNTESVYITAYILFFVLVPLLELHDLFLLALAAYIAMASKYVFAIRKKHIFNPVAVAAVILTFLGSGVSFWWVATPVLFLPIAILGFLIIKKIHRYELFFSFALTSILVLFLTQSATFDLKYVLLSYPIIFLGTIMLTEPLTTPPTKRSQIIYGIIVGGLFAFVNPELALLIGNIFSYIVSPKFKVKLSLQSTQKISTFLYDYSFVPSKKFTFAPGQYMEWTLPHEADNRGNRRYFTLASSPTESEIHLGVRIDPEQASSFKKKLLTMTAVDPLMISQLSGEFIMPKDKDKKLVFIAGGIGITPFRSMIKYLIDMNEKRDIVLMYSARTSSDIAYKEIFDEAQQKLNIKVHYVPADTQGFINSEMVRKEIPDFMDRTFYISGPLTMIQGFEKTLSELKVPLSQFKKDYFPGFA